jgi:LDH2 family malate/lactate/ureidoglycolate dehydrogenase
MSEQDGMAPGSVAAGELTGFVARLFAAAGLSDAAAAEVASGLVEADLQGLSSHGVMLVEMYIERLRQRSVAQNENAVIVSERNGAVVLDAGHALGHLTGPQSMAMAIEKSRQFGAGIVSVRHGFHFGTAGR